MKDPTWEGLENVEDNYNFGDNFQNYCERKTMIKSSIIDILKTFTVSEMNRFLKYTGSPYYNTSRATLLLLKEIKKYYPDFKGRNFTSESMFKKVYGSRKYSDKLMRKLLSNLINLSMGFISTENVIYKEYSLLRGVREKKLYGKFKSLLIKTEQKNSEIILDSEYIIKLILISDEKLNFLYDTDQYREFEKYKEHPLELYFLLFFYSFSQNYHKKSKLYKRVDNYEHLFINLLSRSMNLDILSDGITMSDKIIKEQLIHLISLIKLMQTKDEKLYRKIKEFCFDYSSKFPSEVIYIGYLYLFEFVNSKISKGISEYHKERFELYKKVEKDYFASGISRMNLIYFRNFFNSGIKNKDMGYCEYLINKYISFLQDKGNPGLNKLFKAKLQFLHGNFSESLKLITAFNTYDYTLDDYVLIFDAKILTMQLYYELGFTEAAFLATDAFNKFLRNNITVMNLRNQKYYGNFVVVFRKLINFPYSKDEINKKNLLKKLESEICSEKSWLKEKLDKF